MLTIRDQRKISLQILSEIMRINYANLGEAD